MAKRVIQAGAALLSIAGVLLAAAALLRPTVNALEFAAGVLLLAVGGVTLLSIAGVDVLGDHPDERER